MIDNLEYRPGLGDGPHNATPAPDSRSVNVSGRVVDKLKVVASVALSYLIRCTTSVLTIIVGFVGSILIATCGLILAVFMALVLLVAKPFEWLQQIRQNATGK